MQVELEKDSRARSMTANSREAAEAQTEHIRESSFDSNEQCMNMYGVWACSS